MNRSVQLDGLRAVAALAIFATHVAFLTGFTSANALGPLTARLNVGVALFFLLSAFLLYRPWAEARLAQTAMPDLRHYATRRAVRIIPAYWVVLLVLGLLGPSLVPGALGQRWWVSFGFLQVYFPTGILTGVKVAWSLCTELAFYAVLPVLAYGAHRLLVGRPVRLQVRLELGALAVSAVGAFLLRDVAEAHRWLATYDNTLLGRWPWFAVGLAFAVVSAAAAVAPSPRPEHAGGPTRLVTRAPWLWWCAAATALLVGAYGGLLPREVFAMDQADLQLELVLFAFVAACLMTPLVFAVDGHLRGPARLLSARTMVWLGTVSYGIFLWHYPVITWVVGTLGLRHLLPAAAVSFAITLALATASWYLLERPLMQLAGRRVRRPDRGTTRTAPVLEPAP